MGEIFAGRYELIDPIGRGGVGMVWRAWDHRRRRYVAAKVLQQSDAHTLLRFVREQALRIDHPHVLAPASWAADDEKVLFTMDLVKGGSLAHLIADWGPLPPSFACILLDQLLSGLAAVHAEDVVHRDIKPANILLEPTGPGRPHLRLSDFGISVRKGDPRLTETNFVVGTPGWFAPEQMLEGEVDFPSDLYAVGLVGLFLLTGERPDSQQLFEAYRHGVPDAPERVPEPLWQVLGQLLQPDPAARFRTATGTRKALASAAQLLDGGAPDEQRSVEVADHLGPLPEGFGPDGPLRPSAGVAGGPGAAPGAPPPPAASATGSFHLQPPAQGPGNSPQMPSQPPGTPPTAASPHAPTATAATGATGATQPYPYGPEADVTRTQLGPAHPPASAPGTPPGPAPGMAPKPTGRRPGPPLKVAVPMLAVAVLCLVVGVWALTASA